MSRAELPPAPPVVEAGVAQREAPPRGSYCSCPVGSSPLYTAAQRSASQESQCADPLQRPTREGSFVRSLSCPSRVTHSERHRSVLLEPDEQTARASLRSLLGLDRRDAWDG